MQINRFYEIINRNVKLEKVKKSNHPHWYDKKAINLKNKINRMHKNYKMKNNPNADKIYD